MKKDKEIILFKESALINSEGAFSVLQRNIINAFLFVAKKEINQNLKKGNKFFISNRELKILTSSPAGANITCAIGAVETIKNTWFQVNIDKKDSSGDWPENFSFIQGYTSFSDGMEFELSNTLFEILSDKRKRPFAILDIGLEKKLSKYAGIIFEFYKDYANAKTLPFLSISALRRRLGAKEKYSKFANLEKKLKKALKELKIETGINLFYSVSRQGQTPVKIKFITDNQEQEQNQEKNTGIINNNDSLNIKSITPKNKNSVLVTKNHTLNQIPEQNQELTENNTTDSNMNSVHLEPEKTQIPPERVKEILKGFDLSRLPETKQNELIARYGIGKN